MDGINSGLSNFENYSWKPDATVSMAAHLKRYLNLGEKFVLDFGCARGYYVKALRMLGVRAFGYDISEWATANCDKEVRNFVDSHLNPQPQSYDVVFSKDCLEHVPMADLAATVARIGGLARHTVFIIVPLAKETGGAYVHEKEEKDATHVVRWTLPDWLTFFQDTLPDFIANGSYRYPGLKPGCYEVERGYGFFRLERI